MFKLILPVILLLSSLALRAQDCSELRNDPDLRSELQDLANTAAADLMGCCSKYGGKNLRADIYWDKDETGICQTRISKLTGKVTITMKVSWIGSGTGASYWIKGRLAFDPENKTRTWTKLDDSGGFIPGCSKGCIK